MKYISVFKDRFYIYKISNSLNDKIYIGRTKVPAYRFRQHLSNSNNPNKSLKSQKIHFAIKELGHDKFVFDVFEECENYLQACEREIYWINFYHSNEDDFGYNDKCGVESGISYLTEEGRVKLSKRMSGENNPMFGKKQSPEILQKMSENFSGEGNPFYGKIHSEESKKLIGAASKGRAAGENNPRSKLTLKIVEQIRLDWSTGKYTKVQLSKKYNVSPPSIGHILSFKTWK